MLAAPKATMSVLPVPQPQPTSRASIRGPPSGPPPPAPPSRVPPSGTPPSGAVDGANEKRVMNVSQLMLPEYDQAAACEPAAGATRKPSASPGANPASIETIVKPVKPPSGLPGALAGSSKLNSA